MPLDFTFLALALLAVFVALNVLCWLLFRAWPRLLLSENERLGIDYLFRFEREFKAYIPEWFNIKAEEWPDFVREYNRLSATGHIYAPFVEFRHAPFSGRFLNNHPAGFRHVRNQGPWPPSRDYFNIFFLGGSTTLNVGPDWTSIPSFLQAILNNRRQIDRPIRVYNFGRGSYFSTQEKILFQELLAANVVPDMAIFLDGINDFYFFQGVPALSYFLTYAVDSHNKEHDETLRNRTAARPKWKYLGDFFRSLPLLRAVDRIGEALAKKNASPEQFLYRPAEIDPAELIPALGRYLENKRQIQAICRDRRIAVLFVWQPSPTYNYDLQYHIALNKQHGFGGHERSREGYKLMAEVVQSGGLGNEFLWLGDIQKHEQRPLYLDNMHYTTPFNNVIAQRIAEAMIDRGFVAGRKVESKA